MYEKPKITNDEVLAFKKKMGKNIQALRLRKGMSQQELAEALDIATSTLGCIEIGRSQPKISTLIKISEVLDIEPYEVFVMSDTKNIGIKAKLAEPNIKKLKSYEKSVLEIYELIRKI